MVMGGARARRVMERPERSAGDRKPAGHAQMHHQRFAAGQIGSEELRPPTQPFDVLAGEPPGKPGRQRKPQIRPAHLQPGDLPSLKGGR